MYYVDIFSIGDPKESANQNKNKFKFGNMMHLL